MQYFRITFESKQFHNDPNHLKVEWEKNLNIIIEEWGRLRSCRRSI